MRYAKGLCNEFGNFRFGGGLTWALVPVLFILFQALVSAQSEVVLEGTVRNRVTGSPIEGAQAGPATTDAGGFYTITGDQIGSDTGKLIFTANDYFLVEKNYAIILPLPNTLDADLLPGPGVPLLQGTVRNALTGAPVPGANLYCSTGEIPNNTLRNAGTDSNGFYAYESSRFQESGADGFSCSYLIVTAPGYLKDTLWGVDALAPFPAVRDIELIPTNEVVLQGTVTDSTTGLPIEGASVGPATTDSSGYYSLLGSQLGALSGSLSFFADGYFRLDQNFVISSPLPVTLDAALAPGPATLLQGTVRNALSGGPVAGANLYCSTGVIPNNTLRNVQTDAAGFYAYETSRFLETATDGFSCSYLIITAPGFLKITFWAVEANPPFPEVRDIELIPTDEVVLVGTVTDGNTGLPIEGANVGPVTTDAAGTYSLTGAQVGAVTGSLAFSAEGFYRLEQNFAISSPLPTILDAELAPGPLVPLLQGTVRDAVAGTPVAGANLYCSTGEIPDNSLRNVGTDESGFYAYETPRFLESAADGFSCSYLIITAPGFLKETLWAVDALPPFPAIRDIDLICVTNCAPPNNPPIANSQTLITDQERSRDVLLTGSDPDGDPLTFHVVYGPQFGTLSTTDPSGPLPVVTYNPNYGFTGPDSFTFVARDGISESMPATVSITVNPTVGDEIVLQGVISDVDTGSPIAGAVINWGRTVTDSNGFYALTGEQLRQASGQLVVQAQGYFAAVRQYTLEVPVPNTFNIQLREGGTIVEGLVVDMLSGQPIPGAGLYCSCSYAISGTKRADVDGHYSIDSSDFREEVIPYLTEGRTIGRLYTSASGFLTDTSYVTISLPLQVVNDVALIPRNAVVLQGVVTDAATGAPIPGASVNWGRTFTDVNGAYTLTGAQLGGADGQLVVQAPGHFAAVRSYSLQDPIPNQLDLQLRPAGPIVEGIVVDALTGQPIAGANVYCSCSYTISGSVTTDADGRYSIDSSNFREEVIPYLTEGRTIGRLYTSAGGFLTDTGNVTIFLPLPVVSDVALIPRSEIVLQGVVTDAETLEPIAGASVNWGRTFTDSNGAYTLTGEQLGRTAGQIPIQATGYYAAYQSYNLEYPVPNMLDVALTKGGTIVEGFVTDALSGLPIPGASVYCSCSYSLSPSVTTDADGYYSFDSSAFRKEVIPHLTEGRSIGRIYTYASGFLNGTSTLIVSPPLPVTHDLELICSENCYTNSDTDTIPDDLDNCPYVDNEQQSNLDGDPQGDLCDICPNDPTDSCDTSGSGAAELTADEGGSLTTPDGGLSIEADPGDLPEDTTLSATETFKDDPEVNVTIGASAGLGKALAIYDLEPDGIEFDNPVTLTLTADVTDEVADPNPDKQAANVDRLQGKLDVYLDTDTDGDGITDTFVGQDANCLIEEDSSGRFFATCVAEVDHFSTYALIVPLDSDGDGIPDNFFPDFDACPGEPGEPRSFFNTGELLVATDSDGLATVVAGAEVLDESGSPAAGTETTFTLTSITSGASYYCSSFSDASGAAACLITDVPPDIHHLTVAGVPGCSESSSDQALVVVFDPNGPRATGGGFFYPDAESTPPSESPIDRAHFGFMVRIDNQNQAAGSLEFQYQAAGINLKSFQMDWYTLSNNKAIFQGLATINGGGIYTFRVQATDGDQMGQPDHFDIIIWAGIDTESDPVHRAKNDLAGGNIVVHKK